MGNTIGKSFGWGALFGAIAAFTTGLVHVVLLGYGQDGRPWPTVNVDDFVGSCSDDYGRHCRCCTVCYGRSDRESASRSDRPSPLSYAVLGSLLALAVVIFAVWFMDRGRECFERCKARKGTYLLLPTGLLPVAIVGLFTGWRVR